MRYLLNSTDVINTIRGSEKIKNLNKEFKDSPTKLIDQLYKLILSRSPVPNELNKAKNYFDKSGYTLEQCSEDVAWALINFGNIRVCRQLVVPGPCSHTKLGLRQQRHGSSLGPLDVAIHAECERSHTPVGNRAQHAAAPPDDMIYREEIPNPVWLQIAKAAHRTKATADPNQSIFPSQC